MRTKIVGADRIQRLAACAVLAVLIAVPHSTRAGDTAAVTIKLTQTRFDCEKPLLPEEGFERCEVYTVARFTAPSSALLKVFGHCEVTIRYKTRDGLLEDRQSLHQRFDGAIVDGAGLAPITLRFSPTRISFDPIVEAKATDLRCSIDEAFAY